MNDSIKKEQLFTSVPVKKAVISLAIPTVIAQLITVIYNMADTFFIGQLNNPNQVAAATLAMPIFMFLNAFANLFGIGGASVISRFLGSNNKIKAKQTASFCIWAAVFVSLLYGIIIICLKDLILPIVGTDESTIDYCSSYVFWTVGIGALPTVLSAELAHLIRAEGYSGRASIGIALGGILNIILDPIFIFLFKMDITGAAIVTMLSNVVSMVFFLVFLIRIRKNSCISLSLKFFTIHDSIPFEVLVTGLPNFLMTLMSSVSNLTLNKMISVYSNEAIAGMGIAKKIDLLAFAIAQGMTQGTLPLIGYNYNSGDTKRMKSSLKVLLIYSLVIAFCGMILLFLGSSLIVKCFIDDLETIKYGKSFLQIICISCPSTALNFLTITLFQATGKKTQPLVLALLRKGGLDIPLMFIFNNTIGIKGIAWAIPIADLFALFISIILVIPFLKKLHSQKVLSN